jgi:hypothetical protein
MPRIWLEPLSKAHLTEGSREIQSMFRFKVMPKKG